MVSLYTPHREEGLSTKLLDQIDGHFKVIKKHSALVYTIKHEDQPRTIRKIHIRRLRKWNSEEIPEMDEIPQKGTVTNKEGKDTSA